MRKQIMFGIKFRQGFRNNKGKDNESKEQWKYTNASEMEEFNQTI